MLKRALDIAASGLGLLLLSPLLLAVAIRVKRHDGGGILYGGVRAGRHGVPFRMWKFRTMVMNADRIGGSSTSNTDSRVTPVGRWLRRYKLDELPQLINVLRGEMSLVGPRPEVLEYVNLYTEDERAILSVRPGITDWATLWNADEGGVLARSADPDRDYAEKIRPVKVRLQLRYVREASLGVDLRILLFTLAGIVLRWKPQFDVPDPADLIARP